MILKPAAGALLLLSTVCACGEQVAAVTGGCGPGSGIHLQHEGRGGQATPLAAAEYFGTHFTDAPLRTSADGWRVTAESASEVVLRSDDVEATVVRLRDDTWAVDGARCVR